MRRLIVSSTLALVAIAITLLAPAQLASAADRHPTQATATTIRASAGEMFFRLSAKTAKPGKVTFVVRNIGNAVHDFRINGKKTPLIQPGRSARLVVTLKRGRHPYLCTVFGHAAAGMRGVFRVT